MSRLIDADALERDGWQMSRTVRISKDTMELQTRKPTDFPPIEPQRKRGKWIVHYECPKCGELTKDFTEHCPFCGADMRGRGDDDD